MLYSCRVANRKMKSATSSLAEAQRNEADQGTEAGYHTNKIFHWNDLLK
jgi:hypothetical protein